MKKCFFVLMFCVCSLLVFAQIPGNGIDVQHYLFNLSVNDTNDILVGKATIKVVITKDVDAVVFDLVNKKSDGKGMTVQTVLCNNKPVSFNQDDGHLRIQELHKKFDSVTYVINYSGIPADGLIISKNAYGDRTFFGDNWPNRAHNWLPCNDHLSDKATVDFNVVAPAHYSVISNGMKQSEKMFSNGTKQTIYKENIPIATKLMVIGIADFATDTAGEADGKKVLSYVFRKDSVKGFKSYAYAPQIIDWYVQHIDHFPFEKLADVQSKTIFGGMENAGCIFYSESSVKSAAVEDLMAHEIAHQWFGDAVTEKDWPHLWLSEGFATYMTHVYHEAKYGEDSLDSRLKKDRNKVIAFSNMRLTPVVDTTASKNLMQLLNANSYEKGSWVLHMLRRNIGDSLFWKSIHTYYLTYAEKNADTKDFENIVEKVSAKNLDTFFNQWLYTPGQPALLIKWKYNVQNKMLVLNIEQQQQQLFNMQLEILIKGNNDEQLQNISINKKLTGIEIPVSFLPVGLVADPHVNLLAAFKIEPE